MVGETMDGKWWGGYYGWSWPHGFMNIIESLSIAAMNAELLTGAIAECLLMDSRRCRGKNGFKKTTQ